ncbi:MAG: DegT/DnrJ/EryC1/StrS family aminotransferase [Methanocellales archaeon]|nr:DegT/DnrJ/EryC1/StrS family aminotransferase [Methanocellales archaeon]
MLKLICRDRPTIGLTEFLSIFDIYSGNEEIRKLEEKFAKYIGTDYAVTFSTGRIALYCLYKSLAKGKEIIVPAFGCMPIVDSVVWSGNQPRFADIDIDTYNINIDSVRNEINEKTAIISPVHLFGLPADLDSLLELKEKYDLLLIEDAAMAPGAEYKGRKVGSFGDAAVFSFERSKLLTSYQGGIVTTSSEKIYGALQSSKSEFKNKFLNGHKNILKLYFYHVVSNPYVWRILYNFWRRRHPEETENIGVAEQPLPKKYLIDYAPIQANVALKQLKKLDLFIKKRRKNARYLTKKLEGVEGLALPEEPDYAKHIYARYVVRVKEDFGIDRMQLKEELLKRGVDAGLWYIYSLPYTDPYNRVGDSCQNALISSQQTLTLPNYPSLNDEEVKHIAESVLEIKDNV